MRAQRICVVRQYRHAVGDFLWEIPAGKLDPGEDPRRLRRARTRRRNRRARHSLDALGAVLTPRPGIFTEVIHLYLARELVLGTAQPDVDEELETRVAAVRGRALGHVRRAVNGTTAKPPMALLRAPIRTTSVTLLQKTGKSLVDLTPA